MGGREGTYSRLPFETFRQISQTKKKVMGLIDLFQTKNWCIYQRLSVMLITYTPVAFFNCLNKFNLPKFVDFL
jgi:hypothetical protein